MKVTINDIVNSNLCTGCGVCTSESNNNLKMEWNDDGFLVPITNSNDEPFDDDKAIRVCPFNPNPDKEVEDEDVIGIRFLPHSTQFDEKIGKYIDTYVGYSNTFRNTSSSGGIATYIFDSLLKKKIVDHVYIVKEYAGSYSYQLFSDFNEVKKISKTRYIPVTMESLFLEINQLNGKVAISGVACFIKAIRLKQYYNPHLHEKIPFLVGIICGGWKSSFFTDFLAQNSGIRGTYSNQDYRIKDPLSTASDYSFGAFDSKDQFHEMKMSSVGDMWGTGLFKSRACDFCSDVLTELADISLGDAWLPEYRNDGLGNSIIVTRSKFADQLINEGINSGELSVTLIGKDKIIQSQKPSFAHRQDAILFRIRLSKLKKKITPYIRNRVLKSISLPYAIVQLQRDRTRTKSFLYWGKLRDAPKFREKIGRELAILKWLTIINQKIRGK